MVNQNLFKTLLGHFPDKGVSEGQLQKIMLDSVNAGDFLDSLSEAFRLSRQDLEEFLISEGFEDIVGRAKIQKGEGVEATAASSKSFSLGPAKVQSPFPELFEIECSPPSEKPIPLTVSRAEALKQIVQSIQKTANTDDFLKLYRRDVIGYHDRFIKNEGKRIDKYLHDSFPEGYPRYVISSGIGADEQYCHFAAAIYNQNQKRLSDWRVIDCPKQLNKISQAAIPDNTLFLEFSRSGKTQETVKTHEFTPRQMKRIVFANSGPLSELGKRDNNLILELPDAAPGRFGRNTTPILLAPLYVLRQDTKKIWQAIQEAIERFNPALPGSLPLQMAQFVYAYQSLNRINHCYLGCSGGEAILASADELVQLWNEGVNKEGNDLLMSRYFGQPRDSHTVVEGISANAKTKLAIFLMYKNDRQKTLPTLALPEIDAINPAHQGLKYGEEDFLLAQANYERFKELMPVIRIELKGELAYSHEAVLGQLWQDFVACYAKIIGVDPGSSPEVRAVRDRSDQIFSRH